MSFSHARHKQPLGFVDYRTDAWGEEHMTTTDQDQMTTTDDQAWASLQAILRRAVQPIRSQTAAIRLVGFDRELPHSPRKALRDAWNAAVDRGDLLFCWWRDSGTWRSGFLLAETLERFRSLERFRLRPASDWQNRDPDGAKQGTASY
jgi:hypothetical protein